MTAECINDELISSDKAWYYFMAGSCFQIPA